MIRPLLIAMAAVLATLALAGCDEAGEQAALPPPVELTREAVGHYCNMIVVDHLGPKAQVHLSDREEPLFFTSVRDLVAFSMLPDEPRNIAALYVNDMARASWDNPEPGTWIEAREALFVIGSSRRGGMGALETVPFSERAAAETFAARHGGEVVAFSEIPRDYVLGAPAAPTEGHGHHGSHLSPAPSEGKQQ